MSVLEGVLYSSIVYQWEGMNKPHYRVGEQFPDVVAVYMNLVTSCHYEVINYKQIP